ncbi:AraC family transcriptional regulator [Pararhizobium antarcticum]|nr:AraC family transcriptional regulator [Pararhizobium antarcticum]
MSDCKALLAQTCPIRARILEVISTLPWDGLNVRHQVPGLSLYRLVEPAGPFSSVYEPSLSLIIKGRKFVEVGDEAMVYDESAFFLTAVGMPMKGQIRTATVDEPYVAATLRLNLDTMRRLIVDHNLQPADITNRDRGVAVGVATPELFDAFLRLISLTNSPDDLPFMAAHIQAEIFYRLLTGDQGARLRRFVLSGTNSNRVAKAVAWVKDNYTAQLRIDDLADLAGMGISTLHHQFRAMTGMSPLQFQKHLRLHHARELMLAGSIDVATAALTVGYESPTQFSREYRRMFGHPPLRDMKGIMSTDIAIRAGSVA